MRDFILKNYLIAYLEDDGINLFIKHMIFEKTSKDKAISRFIYLFPSKQIVFTKECKIQ
jgi:hypothetical protein